MDQISYGPSEAARLCGVSRSTIYRKMDTLREYGATDGETGVQIPVNALIRAGLLPSSTPAEKAWDVSAGTGDTTCGTGNETAAETGGEPVEELRARIKELQEEALKLHERISRLELDNRELDKEKSVAEGKIAVYEKTVELQERTLFLLGAGTGGDVSAWDGDTTCGTGAGDTVRQVETGPTVPPDGSMPASHPGREEKRPGLLKRLFG